MEAAIVSHKRRGSLVSLTGTEDVTELKVYTEATHFDGVQDFSEWAQCQVLDFVSRYRPAAPEEVYDIMNALDDRLATPNSAVVLATVRVFLNMTLALPYDHQQVSCPPAPSTARQSAPAAPTSWLAGTHLTANIYSCHCCRRLTPRTC